MFSAIRPADIETTQQALEKVLRANAEDWGIPASAVQVLAENLERIDWSYLLVASVEAGHLLNVDPRHVGNLVQRDFQWMAPFCEVQAPSGKVIARLWLRSTVKLYARVRAARSGVIAKLQGTLARRR